MGTLNETIEQEYDFNKDIEAAEDYQKATGVHCMVIDSDGAIVVGTRIPDICSFCASVTGRKPLSEQCRKTHQYGSYQAERFGGKYIYFCSLSLMFWVSPVFEDGLKKGALVAGPVFAYEPKDFSLKGNNIENILSPEQLKDFNCKLDKLQFVSSDRITSLAELLFITSRYLSQIVPEDEAICEDEILDQQFRISEYVRYIETMEGDIKENHKYPMEKERVLLKQIARADSRGARETLNEILGSVFFQSDKNFEVVKSRILELIVLLSRAALEGGADVEQIFGMNYKYINKIHSFSTVDELAFWLSKIITRFTDLVFNLKSIKHADIIYKAINYINDNFTKKITLEDVAGAVYLSPAYFSKVFKEQTGSSYTQYLNRLRIEESKTLLRNSTIPLVDIAGMVGYEDQSYFSKVFKKVTGSTPGKYRDSRGFVDTDNQEIHE